MSSSNDRYARHQPHQDTKKMSTGHVRVHHVKVLFSNPPGHSSQFQRSPTKVGFNDLNGLWKTLLQPTARATKNCHFVPEPLQLFRQKLAVGYGTIDVATRDNLKDFQAKLYRC